ncbi:MULTISPECIES: LLM class flavin-dependent oxidoreductase [unclassified Paenibacillus]|uniref:LLM class flavin-dependent oxidoreductase n=1 Tax=unclassified Paenibacillus TaxID=185978 RepID=UPI00277FA0B2|nr:MULTISPECIES: LLM class flavin-dependent oxidoreductase [unclassified Paenibacillus]MDQ0903761.1 luciferase family oxidoreductase group 1 [Paenibacillus sp. V4I7]MDQ0917765.1 luciferase family oxidoreductase group 1 [Paenibacillus sp. V4I5]
MLKLSILDQSPVSSGFTHSEALQQTIGLAQVADRLGYTRFWVSEHHNSAGLAGSSPEVLLSTLAARTSRIRLGSGGVLLPHYSPYKVAENFRMLEALYPGRIDLGIGRAPGGTPHTAKALRGISADMFEGLERFPAQVTDLLGFLADSVEPGHVFEGIRATPLVDSMPQVWLLGSTGQSGVYASQAGAAFCFAHFINGAGGQHAVRSYRSSFRPSALNVVPQATVCIYVLCAETQAEAEGLAASIDLRILQMEKGEFTGVKSPEEAANYVYSDWDHTRVRDNRSRMIIGDPNQVREQVLNLAESYQVDEVMVVAGGYRFETRMQTIKLLAEAFNLEMKQHAF